MSLSQSIFELAQKHPKRKPGSVALKDVFTELKKIAATWGVNTELQKIPVYNFKISLLAFVTGSIGAVLLSLVSPGLGLVLAIGLFWLFLRELIQPFLAKIKPTPGENFIIQIPARSKENQKIILAANISTDSFFEPGPGVSVRLFLIVVYALGLLIPVCLLLYWWLRASYFQYFTVIPILTLFFISLYTRKTATLDSNLNKASVLLEVGDILLKSRPLSTSVTLFFTGAKSLNSGALPLSQFLKTSRAPLNYVINLTDLPDKRINVVTADGEIISRPSEPLLIDYMMEISREKKIPIQDIRLQQFTETYPLKFKKIMTVSLTHPQEAYSGENANRDLRELLLGIIRKLD
ncbi:MAG TPA: hypothetical protein VHY08_04400 [Bacillota bacterium]|nr:hypothetical protein [Bacillota bacterium]